MIIYIKKKLFLSSNYVTYTIAKRQSFEAHINRLCSESEQCGNLVLIVYVIFKGALRHIQPQKIYAARKIQYKCMMTAGGV